MNKNDFKIIDSHVHFLVKETELTTIKREYVEKHGQKKWDILQQKNAYQQERWKMAWGFPKQEPIEDTIEETAQKWITEMNNNGVEKMVFVTAGDTECSNENMTKIIDLYPDRFIGYAYHGLFDRDAADKLDVAITKQGLRGYKILAPDLPGRIDDKSLYSVWEVANHYKIPVLIHFGILGGAGGVADHVNISPMRIHDVARVFPEVPFIIPHFGCGQIKDLLQLAWVCPNIYVDTSGSNQWIRWMPYPLTIKDLYKKYYETIGPQRIIFGTDSSWFSRGFVKSYFDEQIRACVELGMSNRDLKMIFHDNMAELISMVSL
ncbi:MAG: amidohydrolase family protein [Thermotaleaceae bacterium]